MIAGPKPLPARLVIATELGSANDGVATAAALGVAVAARHGDERSKPSAQPGEDGVLVVQVGASARRRPTLLSSTSARTLEERLRAAGLAGAAARGRICWLGLPLDEGWPQRVREAVRAAAPLRAAVLHLPPGQWRTALEDPALTPGGALLRADVAVRRPLVALAVWDLRDRGVAVRVATRSLGLVGARRALAGLDPGGAPARRLARFAGALVPERGQALPLVLGSALLAIFVALALAALGGAVTGTAREQRAADLAALSAARSMRDDLPRLTAPQRLPDGSANPRHLAKGAYLARAAGAARDAAMRNDIASGRLRVRFPDSGSVVPLRARVALAAEEAPTGRRLWAEAVASPPASASGPPASASGGGYAGPLAYRQGKPMRPDVAGAFDRLAAAAGRAGIALVITSGYRSDAEQARLYAQNPDPRWVAPPGRSLHRCGTELDLGPSSAYGWLAANARRFGFIKRYSWEPWHFGFVRGPAPCSAVASRSAARGADGSAPSAIPAFVPAQYRAPIVRAAARWDVSAILLAAQLQAESGFNPRAVSPAGARGIAQFMPGTAAAYGLRDPFDPAAAINAQAHLMSDLLAQFGSAPLALAAYNAGPAPVAACTCVPSYPETQAYVARILALMGGAGELVSQLEVRLVA